MDIQRKEFEEWAKANGYHVAKNPIGEVYLSLNCNNAWKAWRAAKAQAVPEGFVVVPKEPTERMLDSAYSSISDNLHYADLESIYKAMIWSAQEQSHDLFN